MLDLLLGGIMRKFFLITCITSALFLSVACQKGANEQDTMVSNITSFHSTEKSSEGSKAENTTTQSSLADTTVKNIEPTQSTDEYEIFHASGLISEITDTQFVLTTDDGDVVFQFTTPPNGLDTVLDGEMVIVEYTGEIDPTVAFTGEIFSVHLYDEEE